MPVKISATTHNVYKQDRLQNVKEFIHQSMNTLQEVYFYN